MRSAPTSSAASLAFDRRRSGDNRDILVRTLQRFHGAREVDVDLERTRVASTDSVYRLSLRAGSFLLENYWVKHNNMPFDGLVLDGVMTDCCVLNTAFDASNLGYNVVLLRDLVRGTNEEMEAAALKIVSLHLGLVMDAGDLLAAWRGRGARAAAE